MKAVHAISDHITESEKRKLLAQKISDLPLMVPGSWLEELINELYQELEKAGLSFKPKTYLSDEWGCPHGVPVIGIPFYLADPRLRQLESQLTHIEAENAAEVLLYLRHESGHAINYAYRLYNNADWEKVFGKFSLPYDEIYRTSPFSTHFVRHIPGWYAQKHPDDDFAETFAVWLTPDSQWRLKYSHTKAMDKLIYVDKLMRVYGKEKPLVTDGRLDRPLPEMEMTLEDWYKPHLGEYHYNLYLPDIIDEDLRRLFPDKIGPPVIETLQSHQMQIIRDVNYWTGIDRYVLKSLVDELRRRIQIMSLNIDPEKVNSRIQNLSVFLTTLAMNYQVTGQFLEE